jgi:hypothetical protein
MYILAGRGVGDAPSRMPWRVRLGLRSTPQYLRFLILDQFPWNRASLTAPLRRSVESLAKHVQLSWKTTRPIAYIRLIGHTDNTGTEKHNADLGGWRAQAVKKELENLLKEDILKGRIRIAILTDDSSPGASAPIANNNTEQGRARNRRVEVFVAPPKKEPIIRVPPEPPPISVIQTKPEPYPQPVPALPRGKSFKEFIDEWLRDHHVPKFVRNKIWNAIVGKDFGLVSTLLNAAGISGSEREAFVETVRILAEAPAR